ncbi:recombinase family protein, partial [Tardiphaga sp.]|uniref:recombinase family protein n=1 Tax=Tardiphaga sp. TaxID=1926292 RepID=UPI00352B3345
MARKNLNVVDTAATTSEPRPRNVLIYSRVSTLAQAQNMLSSDDQIAQLVAKSKREGDNIVGIFRDEGETGTNMKRSGFEEMIARATDGSRTVDAILVYSFSRAFRNQVEQELTVQSLRKHRVELISHAEPLANDDTGDMFRKFIGIVNEYQSKETARATTRTMLANARLGYSNGGNIPYGYMSVDSDIVGNKQKKKLAVEPVESEVVKLAFNLALSGDGTTGPLGTKKISMWLNERGYRTRKGSLFGTGTVHELLTREAYTGSRRFNEFDRKIGERKKTADIIEYDVPEIIDRATFDAVQALLVSRQPRLKGPRLASAPSLLGGLVRCDCAKSCALTTATGTSRTGTVYNYYKCVQAIKQGRHKHDDGASCSNRKIPRPVIEKLVVEALLDQLLQPERVTAILTTLKARRDGRQASADRRLVDLARQVSDAGERLSRLYASIEAGTIDGTDPSLKERVAGLKATRDRAMEALEYAKNSSVLPVEIDPVAIERFTRLMREQLVFGDVAARKAYLSAIIDAIVVSDTTIRIIGSNDNIRAALGPNGQPTHLVRKSVQEWCPWPESNQHSLRNSILS